MEASDEVYEYISCNLCLVKLEDPGLVYTGEKFEHKDRRWQIGMLVHGFIFPSFEDRTSDIHNITVFNKKSDGALMTLIRKFSVYGRLHPRICRSSLYGSPC